MTAINISDNIKFICPFCGASELVVLRSVLEASSIMKFSFDPSNRLTADKHLFKRNLQDSMQYYRCASCHYPDHDDRSQYKWREINDVLEAGAICFHQERYSHRCLLISASGKTTPIIAQLTHPCPPSAAERVSIIEKCKKRVSKSEDLILLAEGDSKHVRFKASVWKSAFTVFLPYEENKQV